MAFRYGFRSPNDASFIGMDLLAGYSVLQISFIPEPGMLLLIGAATGALAALARRRA
jgi:hypothetical protein